MEYFILRIIRKYIFTENILLKFGNFIPYYKITSGQSSPIPIVKKYLKYLLMENLDIKNKNILEIGIGATNGTCYELAYCGANFCYAYEPYVKYNKKLDDKIILEYPKYKNIIDKVSRIKGLTTVNYEAIDVVFSNSVLEHVENIEELCQHLKRIMKNNAWMIHMVDYQDHFYRYKFNFYKFSKSAWRVINPGLSRLRINDHLKIFKKYGFEVKILDKEVAIEDYRRFKSKNKIANEFVNYCDDDLATINAVIFARNII